MVRPESRLSIIRFAFLIFRLLGWSGVQGFWTFSRNKPKYKERYLEIALFATKPGHQQEGYGTKMLRYLYEEVKKKKFDGIILAANCGNPAFDFYLKEGFTVDIEFEVDNVKGCWMRRTNK